MKICCFVVSFIIINRESVFWAVVWKKEAIWRHYIRLWEIEMNFFFFYTWKWSLSWDFMRRDFVKSNQKFPKRYRQKIQIVTLEHFFCPFSWDSLTEAPSTYVFLAFNHSVFISGWSLLSCHGDSSVDMRLSKFNLQMKTMWYSWKLQKKVNSS